MDYSFQAIYQGQRDNGLTRSASAEMVLDVATNGTWAIWDQDRINKMIAYIINQCEDRG